MRLLVRATLRTRAGVWNALWGAALILCLGASAQQSAPATNHATSPPQKKTIAPARVADGDVDLRMDGELDEPVWRQAAAIAGFTQTDPDLGKPVSEKTEALMFYDSRNIYFGFRCYDSRPSKVIYR